MAKRFRGLETALKYLRPPGLNVNAPSPEAPNNTQLKEYQDWRSRKKTVTYGRREAHSKTNGSIRVTLLPFGAAHDSSVRWLVKMSSRAADLRPTAGLIDDVTGLQAPTAGAGTAAPKGFIPAKVTVHIATAIADEPVQSKITGAPYYPRIGATSGGGGTGSGSGGGSGSPTQLGTSLTVPFGKQRNVASEQGYAARKAAIIAAVAAVNPRFNVNFSPEYF